MEKERAMRNRATSRVFHCCKSSGVSIDPANWNLVVPVASLVIKEKELPPSIFLVSSSPVPMLPASLVMSALRTPSSL